MKKILLLIIAVAFTSGCGEVAKKKKKKKKLTRVEELHRKAKIAEAASIVGYDGKSIHKRLDKMIKLRELDTKNLNNALKDMQ